MEKEIMTNKYPYILPVSEIIARDERRSKERDSIEEKNKKLIAYWKSIPWWKFWLKPSFEEQRSIIISNWSSLNNKD